MAKPTTGHVQPRRPDPDPDPDQMAADTLMTSVFSGICFVIAVVVYGLTGGTGLHLAASSGRTAAMVAFGVGLAVGLGILVLLLRRFSGRIRARSNNLYRGAWIGSIAALVIIIVMYYMPWIAFPEYCPPGSICQ